MTPRPKASLCAATFGIAATLTCLAITLPLAPQQTLSPGEVRASSWTYRPESHVLRKESPVVRADVVVRDINGRPVPGLTKNDFAVLDSGHPRDIVEFSAETEHTPPAAAPKAMSPPAPTMAHPPASPPRAPVTTRSNQRWIALFFDDENTPPGDLSHAKIAAARFVHEATGSGDRLAVYTTSGGKILDFTTNAANVIAASRNVGTHLRVPPGGLRSCPRMNAYEAYQIVSDDPNALQAKVDEACHCSTSIPCDGSDSMAIGATLNYRDPVTREIREQAQETWALARRASRAALDAIGISLGQLAQMPGKRMLLLASSGFLSGDLDAEKDAIINEALHAGVVMNSLDAKGLYAAGPTRPLNEPVETTDFPVDTEVYEIQSLGDRLDSEDSVMARFAESTGGLLFRNNNDLNYGFRELGLAPAYSYELGFVPDEDGKYHKIKVELKNGSHDFIQARPGYFAPTKGGSAPTAAEKVDAEMLGSDERSDFPATVRGALGAIKSGQHEITVQTHVDISKLPFEKQKDRHDEKLTFVAGLFDPQGKFITGKEAEMDLALKQDSFERFSKTGITGTMSLEAPPGKYRLRVVVEEAVKGEMAATTQKIQIP